VTNARAAAAGLLEEARALAADLRRERAGDGSERARIGERLTLTVIRPLERVSDGAVRAHAAPSDQRRDGRHGGAGRRIVQLAVRATLHCPPDAPPALHEAVAALRDLAVAIDPACRIHLERLS